MDSADQISAFAQNIGDKSANGIALETRALIRAGILQVGSQLPTVRDVALALEVSPATVAAAWAKLKTQGIVEGRGRNGTWIRGDRSQSQPRRFASVGRYAPGTLDLTWAVPDPALLPPLAEALAHAAQAQSLNSYQREMILPELAEAIRAALPYEPEALLASNGGYSAIYTILHALSLAGGTVAIEHPTAMRHLDILEDIGVTILPVDCDREGPLPASLQAAMARRPAVFLFQPRLHSVTGQCVSPARLHALGNVLEGSDTIIIEDDGLGDLADIPAQSLGARFPDRVAHVLSLSKTHGPDLRLAVIAASMALIEQVRAYRSFSSGWTSRITQAAGAWLLRDSATQERVALARTTYNARRERLAQEIVAAGGEYSAGSGLCLWLPVASEAFAVVTLAAHGIAISPGNRFTLKETGHLRVATALPTEFPDRIAQALVLASLPG
ncbi:PLP-dependent aminotransferase family protein [Thioclava sp. BHET1]|nr:PLP-dependent aminotransferase family protein [Thioclava sp. BHET1]